MAIEMVWVCMHVCVYVCVIVSVMLLSLLFAENWRVVCCEDI